MGKESVWGARHDQPFHVIGSDAAGVVVRVGSAVRNWRVGDKVVVHCNFVDDQDPSSHDDSMLGATGGIGAYAVQLVLNGGGIPIGVVSSPRRAELLRSMGCERVIDRAASGYQFWSDAHTQDEAEWRRLGKQIRSPAGDDPDIVFEHPGRSTMGASVFVAKRGGTIVTCAASSGYMIEYDNRHLWMKLKRIVSSHFANYQEVWDMNRLIDRGAIQPVLSACFPLDEVGEDRIRRFENR